MRPKRNRNTYNQDSILALWCHFLTKHACTCISISTHASCTSRNTSTLASHMCKCVIEQTNLHFHESLAKLSTVCHSRAGRDKFAFTSSVNRRNMKFIMATSSDVLTSSAAALPPLAAAAASGPLQCTVERKKIHLKMDIGESVAAGP